MNARELNATQLLSEYDTIVRESTGGPNGEIDWTKLRGGLAETAEWTDFAAAHLVDLVSNYGSFMLRNALALAVAAGIEDGEMGF